MSTPLNPAAPATQHPAAPVPTPWPDTLLAAWQRWDPAALLQACDAAAAPILAEAAHWRGLAAYMAESGDALAWLEQAWHGHAALGQQDSATVTAHVALTICLLDHGAMDRLRDWQDRVDRVDRVAAALPCEPVDALSGWWLQLGTLARVALGQADTPAAAHTATLLLNELMPLQARLSAHERLLTALVLIEYHFAVERFEQFDHLASLVEQAPMFDAAAPMLRARWMLKHGWAHYQAGNPDRAEASWKRSMALGREFGLVSVAVQGAMALARLLLDRGRVGDAEETIESLDPRWGSGRTAQLIELQQVRARVQLARGQPNRALATLEEANRLAEAAGISNAESGSRLTDLAQVYIALDRLADAQALLARMVSDATGRDGQVNGCLLHLLQAWMNRHTEPERSRADLEHGLSLAIATRYTMFFRLVPAMAASVCALALRAELSPLFVDEVIRARKLPAPADADARWPWPLWLGLLGGFELRCDGQLEPASAKTQQKPLELLRLLACERSLSLGMEAAMAALWPDADDAAARKSFEMAALRLRRLLGDASLLRVGDGRVGLDAARASSDVQQRRRLIERIEALAMRATGPGPGTDPGLGHGPGPHDECLVLVERVIGFTRGELLPGLPAVPWLEAERQRCRNDTVRAALAAATVLERLQVGTSERKLLEAALRIEPLAESLVRRLMQAHTRAGQRGDALRVFEGYRQQLAVIGATPGPLVEAQWRALLAQPAR